MVENHRHDQYVLETPAVRAGLTVNPESFGAVGDGASDDTAAFINCYASARGRQGTVVLTPGKTYIVGSYVDVTGTTTIASGATIRVKPGYTLTDGLFRSTGPFHWTGGCVDLNGPNTPDPGVNGGQAFFASNASGWVGCGAIRDVEVVNGWSICVEVNGTQLITDPTAAPSGRFVIEGNTVTGGGIGIQVSGVADVDVTNNRVSGCGIYGIYTLLTSRVSVTANNVTGCAEHGIVDLYSCGLRVTANHSSTNTLAGITVGGGSTTIAPGTRFTITGNVCMSNGTHGIFVDTTKYGALTTPVPAYGAVVGNLCYANAGHGIYVNNSQYVTVTGNTCAGSVSEAGILVASANTTIVGNLATGNAQGIYLAGTTGNHVVKGNNTLGNTAGYIWDSTVPGDQSQTMGDAAAALRLIKVGQETFARMFTNTQSEPLASGVVKFAYFVANKTQTATKASVETGTAAGATPTLCRLGLYSVDAAGDLTLVASTVNDTSLFSTSYSVQQRSFSSPYTLVEGMTYALAVLCVTAAATPTFAANNTLLVGADHGLLPLLGGETAGHLDLPASISSGSISTVNPIFGVVRP